jgi:hypothetical protein
LMRKIGLTVASLCALSSTAAAQCPANLETASKITLAAGDTFRRDITRNADGTIDITRKMPAQREPTTTKLFKGLLPIGLAGTNTGKLTYTTDPATIFPLEAGKRHVLPYKGENSKGETFEATMTIEVRGNQPVKIGDCTLDAIIISRTTRFASGQRTPTFVEYYAPSVGFVVRAGMITSDGTIVKNADETFETISVGQ